MNKSPIEIAVGQTNILIEDAVCKAVGRVGIHINKEELLKALKAYEFVEELTNYIFTYPDDDYMTMECLCRKLHKHGLLDKVDGYYQTHEIRTNTHECVKDTHDKDEPTISKMEQVEQRSCDTCKNKDIEGWKNPCLGCIGFAFYEPKDEPQYDAEEVAKDINRRVDMVKKEWNARHMDEPQTEPLHTCSVNGRPYNECSSCEHFKCTADEPQTDCAWK